MKNVLTIILALACAIFAWLAYTKSAEATMLKEQIHACEEAAQASSAEAFILQQQAEKHRAEAEEHKRQVEEHAKTIEKLQSK